MTLDFETYARELSQLGSAITPELLEGTRALISPHLEVAPVPDVHIDRDVSYGDDERQRLDVFTAVEGGSIHRPLLVFVHGGGFVAGDKYTPGTPFYDNVGIWAVRNGFNAITITYRLAPDHVWPSGIEDLHRMTCWLRLYGHERNISGQKLFLLGQSAGACHVASYLAHADLYAPDPSWVNGVILLSGMYDFTTLEMDPNWAKYVGSDPAGWQEKSCLTGLVESEVPMLASVSEFDPQVFKDQGRQLSEAYEARYVKSLQLLLLKGQNHISSILYLGLEGDMLGPRLKQFIAEQA